MCFINLRFWNNTVDKKDKQNRSKYCFIFLFIQSLKSFRLHYVYSSIETLNEQHKSLNFFIYIIR